MGACLVQAFGPTAIAKPTGYFKTFGLILVEFKKLVQEATPAASFLVQGVQQPAAHRNELLGKASSFRLLPGLRAAGLHAGRGLTWETTVVQANLIADFLELLGRSSRLKPYLNAISRCPYPSQPRALLLEDLTSRLAKADPSAQSGLLASIFLILPEAPEGEPDWLASLERVSVVPESKDISYLLDAVGKALPATLERTSSKAEAIRVKVRPAQEGSISITPHYLRRSFNQIRDRWHADVGNANGRLDQGFFAPPPVEAVREVFARGLTEADILEDGEDMSAHAAWVFVAASLSCAGTLGPYWFLVRRSQDLGQLRSRLRKAAECGSKTLRNNLPEATSGILAIEKSKPLSCDDVIFSKLGHEIEAAVYKKEQVDSRLERWAKDDSKPILSARFTDLVTQIRDSHTVTPAIEEVLSSNFPTAGKSYWARTLAEISTEQNDTKGLLEIFFSEEAPGALTAARKALRRIDFHLYGPPIDL